MYHLLFVIQERGKFNSMVDKHSRELSDLKASLTEESDARTRLQLELDARESEIEQLKQKLVASDTVSISSGNDLDTDLDAVGMYIFVGKSHLSFRIFCVLKHCRLYLGDSKHKSVLVSFFALRVTSSIVLIKGLCCWF